MKNTPENKAKFFALYWLQDVLSNNMQGPEGTIYAATMKTRLELEDEWLELKPLSQITDEDAIEVAKGIGYDKGNTEAAYIKVGSHVCENMFQEGIMEPKIANRLFDFLRSKGYALPYMGISVEQQIEFGWVKLDVKER